LNDLKKIRHTLPGRTEFPSLITHGNTPKKALKETELVVAESIKWIEEEKAMIPELLGARYR